MNALTIVKEKALDLFRKPVDIARTTTISLLTSGRITETEAAIILAGFEKVIVEHVAIDNSTHSDNSIHIDGDVCQSAVGQAAMAHKLKESEIFWNRSSNR